MHQTPHPSSFLNTEWTAIIRQYAAQAEQRGSLHSKQLELIYRQQWFKLFVPNVYGGLQFNLPDAIKLEEGMSWADGSFGWTVTLCCGAGWFGGFLSPDIAEKIFADRDVCLGGSGAPTGTANITSTGYEINGQWKYATGAPHTTWFTANCVITEENTPVLNADGSPLILSFIFKKDEVELVPAWSSIGMVATGSHSFAIKKLHVPTSRCFKIDAENTVIDNPVHRYPFLQLAETTLAANISGMAIHFMDLCEQFFEQRMHSKKLTDKQKQLLNGKLRQVKDHISELRVSFYQYIERSWQFCNKNESIPQQILQATSVSSRALARYAITCTDELYPFCGLIAANPASEINRVWRDIHTASQHSLLTFSE
ncbi:acyl-CoA dehydrogenase [Pedobacter sp. BS3]|uniref:acyl-CoA dehydrogenase n=1 Tax=Pedobacter sp. BS3 TaxID=2567937 RepID=UPI0011EF8C8E|nr:acyl-CoA dehydrogenase [Pedobacter sp. BS3]TZF82041.1 acyl-CoA dehydrogenase [Pedobacter sp. BS3]